MWGPPPHASIETVFENPEQTADSFVRKAFATSALGMSATHVSRMTSSTRRESFTLALSILKDQPTISIFSAFSFMPGDGNCKDAIGNVRSTLENGCPEGF